MDIFAIADKIYKEDPQKPNTIQISMDQEADANMLFETAALLLLEGVQRKVISSSRRIDDSIKMLEKYFKSAGLKLYVKREKSSKFLRSLDYSPNPTFYNTKSYDVETCFLVIQRATGNKQNCFLYNPFLHKVSDISQVSIYMKHKNGYYKAVIAYNK